MIRNDQRSAALPDTPSAGTSVAIAPGVRWIRMPLPFVLDHVNLWAIDDGEGWAIVDTGIQHPMVIAAWDSLLAGDLEGRPVTRLILTHMHPDHAGLAGWFVERFGCDLWMTRTEYLTARSLAGRTGAEPVLGTHDFYRKAGWKPEEIAANLERRTSMARLYAPFPDSYRRLIDRQELVIGGRRWHVIAGGGHTPEHACLECPELDLLISGDKVLPGISSNISVDAAEPDADPLAEWFDTLSKLRSRVSDRVTVLPSHKRCFTGLHARIDALIAEQRDALTRLEEALASPRRIVDLFEVLFRRPIDHEDLSSFSLATGEAAALLAYLRGTRRIEARVGEAGALFYQTAAKAGRV